MSIVGNPQAMGQTASALVTAVLHEDLEAACAILKELDRDDLAAVCLALAVTNCMWIQASDHGPALLRALALRMNNLPTEVQK